MTRRWPDASEFDGSKPVDEVLTRLRGYRNGELEAFLWSPARWEQDLEPLALAAEDRQLGQMLLTLPADRAVIEDALREAGAEKARDVLRHVVIEWEVPGHTQVEVLPYLQRRYRDVTWILEEVRLGVTAVQVQISISSPLPDKIPYQAFYPRPAPYLEESMMLEPWWDIFTRDPITMTDDLGTPYTVRRSEGGGEFPLHLTIDGHEQARKAERYLFTFFPGLPIAATNLTISGTIDLAIEQPVTESPPWPTAEITLDTFNCTIDLRGWWPDVIAEYEDLDED